MSEHRTLSAADAYDLLMGLSRLTGSALVADIARVVGDLAPEGLTNALNAKQIASKMWLVDQLASVGMTSLATVTVLGGWYGVLSAMLLNDTRFAVGHVVTVDLDPACAPVAELLNRRASGQGRFSAITSDMYQYRIAAPNAANDLVVNTSCEHIPDLRGWLETLPKGSAVLLQSNNYRAVPEHIACVDSAAELAELAGLAEVRFAGALQLKNYTRFMVIGRV